MSFFGNALKHPGWYTGGLGFGLAMNNFGQPESNPALPYRTGPAATASDVKIDGKLTKALGAVGDPQSAAITGAYTRAGAQSTADARPTGSYYSDRLATGNRLSQGGLTSGLEGVLGGEGYADWKGQRDFGENMDLAKLTGQISKPSTLEEVLGGLNGGANAAGNFYGLYNSVRKPTQYNKVMNYGQALPMTDAGSFYGGDERNA